MFERYTERARRVLFFARYEAGRAGGPAVEPEHLLLALLREGKGLSARIFERARVSPNEVRRAIESRTTHREAISSGDDLPLSASTKQVLEFAAQESDRLLHNYVGTEHLLLGVFREERSLAASILAERGLQINQVRDDIVMLLGAPPAMPPERIEKYFRIGVAAEVRDMDVYVLTAPNGAISATRTSLDEPGSFGWVDIQTPASPENFIGFGDPPWRRDKNEAPTEDELNSMAGEFLKTLAGGWKRGTASILAMSAMSTMAQLCEILEASRFRTRRSWRRSRHEQTCFSSARRRSPR